MITTSLCMIVKNEEKVLARCLDSLAGLFDEIIIADTGSTDSTREIAQKYTDKVYAFEWTGSFSDARNFVFSKATMDYIYSADADEVLDEENRNRFIELKNVLIPDIEIVQMIYVSSSQFATTESIEKEYRPKLYKRLRTFTWIDPVHESVNLNPVVYDSDIEILHMPVSAHQSRDFEIFRKCIDNGTKLSPKLTKMYAMELMVSGSASDLLKAAPYFESLLFDEEIDESKANICYCILAKNARINSNIPEFFKWSMKAVISGSCSEICCELGAFYQSLGDYVEAVVWYINAVNETSPILDEKSSSAKPLSGLSLCYEKMAAENELLKDTYLEMANEYRIQADSNN